ncbi:Ubiquitin-conjugating enzyme E2 2 [Zea mays]|uniref:Ubiquitin-conjugating enzyme E2 2 n=1 Tax=Zea mays TaxID=4577 RepID=A0A1D6HT33_MAIZE|nr:Ubiquitin-conjugating enzyme E2 2 [Zea mays]
MLFTSSSDQAPSTKTLPLKTWDVFPLSFHHFVLANLACLSLWIRIQKQKSTTTRLC